MIKIYKKTVRDKELKTLTDFEAGSWVYVENPSEEELKFLARDYSLELGHLKDAVDPYEAPRLEIEGDVTYVFTCTPHKRESHIVSIPVMVTLGKDFLVTVSREPLPFLKEFTEGTIEFFTTQKIKLFLQIFSQINGVYNQLLTDINRNVRRTSVRLEKIKNEDIARFVAFETTLNDFADDLVPTNTILKKLLSGRVLKLYEKDKDLVEDLLLANEQLIETCQTNLKTIGNIREAYQTIMTNNLNRVIRLLTALTIVLTIPTIVASIYGMNIKLPRAGSPLAFWEITGTTAVLSFVLLWIFRRKDWF